jgi:hypothetical protein
MSRIPGRSLWVVLACLGCLAAVGIACNLPTSGGQAPKLDAAEAVNPDTQPIPVSLTLDQTHAASAVIGPEGGSLTATGADGTKYMLEIPAKALVEDVEIAMVPITSIEGIPWKDGGLVGAVQLEPDGQTFYSYVDLTIQPAADEALDHIIPVGATGPNHALYMPFVDPKSRSLILKLDHFSSAGAAKGLLADTEPWRQRLGGDVEARLQSIVARELAQARQDELMGVEGQALDSEFMDWLIATWKKDVLQPRLDAAGESCAAGRLAIQTLLDMSRLVELMGIDTDLGVNLTDLMPTVSRVCIKEEYELCRDQHIIHRMIPVLLGMARQDELLGLHDDANGATGGQSSPLDQVEAEGWDLARKCLTFELQFESHATLGTGDG